MADSIQRYASRKYPLAKQTIQQLSTQLKNIAKTLPTKYQQPIYLLTSRLRLIDANETAWKLAIRLLELYEQQPKPKVLIELLSSKQAQNIIRDSKQKLINRRIQNHRAAQKQEVLRANKMTVPELRNAIANQIKHAKSVSERRTLVRLAKNLTTRPAYEPTLRRAANMVTYTRRKKPVRKI